MRFFQRTGRVAVTLVAVLAAVVIGQQIWTYYADTSTVIVQNGTAHPPFNPLSWRSDMPVAPLRSIGRHAPKPGSTGL